MHALKRQTAVFWRWLNAGAKAEAAIFILSLVMMAGAIVWQFGLPGAVFVLGAALYIGGK